MKIKVAVTLSACYYKALRPAGWLCFPDLSDGAVSSNDEVSALRDTCDGNVDLFSPAAVSRCCSFVFHCCRHHLSGPRAFKHGAEQEHTVPTRAACLSRWLGNKLCGCVPAEATPVTEVDTQSPHLASTMHRSDAPAACYNSFWVHFD